ncbi:MAG: histidine kinase [Deltaproteobacteria bacterium]|nr:MAG: histidine kinase [Deltaproteobacteria bacterium]
MSVARREQLLKEIDELKEKLRDREAALPAHSVRPHQLLEIEELEEKIAELKRMLGETNQ